VVPAGTKIKVKGTKDEVLEVLEEKLGQGRRREGWGTAVARALG